MSQEAVARRYARAIFEIGKETGGSAMLSREFASFANTYAESAELKSVLDNPLIAEPEREAVIQDVALRLGLSVISQNALKLLARKRRLPALTEIAAQLARLVDEDEQVVRAVVKSPKALSDSYVAKLKAALELKTGKKVVIAQELDPSLIAGVVTQIGDQVIDGSVRARLSNFRDTLLRS